MSHYSQGIARTISGLALALTGLLIYSGCANPIPPTGGPKDSTPPTLILEESTPNFLTDFNQKEIILTFDEWIQLRDPFQQVVISPPLVKRPEIKLKGKSVRILIDANEVLREQTTYTINFGASIVDLSESNPLDQFQYIFSTGSFIDSLSTSGIVVQSSDGAPAKGALILLNENLSDTAFTKTTPTYFTKADESGRWKINYIRSDTFRIYALKDLNANYKYDQPGEEIAFLDELVILPDTADRTYRLKLFIEEFPPAILDVNRKTPGVTKLTLTAPGKDIDVSALSDDRDITWYAIQDTLAIWYPDPDSVSIVVREGEAILDTIRLLGYQGQGAPRVKLHAVSRSIHPAKPLILRSNNPLRNVVPSQIYALLNDTIIVTGLDVRIDTTDNRVVEIAHNWQEKGAYQLVVPAGSMTDIFGGLNDTTDVGFQVSTAGNFGQIFLSVQGLVDSIQYVVQLLQQNGTVVDQFVISGASEGKGTFKALPPQGYQVRIVEDLNANKRRDTGIFTQHRQPERVQIESLEPLRAGWDLEATLTWKEQQN